MTDPTRDEILRGLSLLSERMPEVRFGQLIANLAFRASGPCEGAQWDMEDEQLLSAIRQQLADLSNPQTHVA